jgi:abortive infection bacteriophage resistance protein
MRFTKPALSFDDQLDRLIARGLSVPDRARALHYLEHINYYRLGAYWLPFESDHATHRFREGACFDDVLNLYIFDREFRLLLLDAIERIEVSVRTHWAYKMAHRHGPHCHLDPALFRAAWNYPRYRRALENEVERSQETFIRHLRATYDEPLPPIWALVEIMTFGQLSMWYTNAGRRQDRNAVARVYGLDERILTSFLHHLTTVRNHCAHHARLWNREFTVLPRVPNQGDQRLLNSLRRDGDRRIYNTLTVIVYLMDRLSPQHHWRRRLLHLLETHGIDPEAMGFPPDWQARPLWGPEDGGVREEPEGE